MLGPHCHVACARQLDPGERKLLRLRRSPVAVLGAGDALTLLEEGDRLALGSGGRPGSVLEQARAIRSLRRGLDRHPLDRHLVEAATVGGARALGMHEGPGRIGTLGPGSRADLAIFDVRGRYPYSALLDRPACVGTVVGSTVVGSTVVGGALPAGEVRDIDELGARRTS